MSSRVEITARFAKLPGRLHGRSAGGKNAMANPQTISCASTAATTATTPTRTVRLLNRLWKLANDRFNYLTPTINPIGYGRDGQRRRHYDQPKTRSYSPNATA